MPQDKINLSFKDGMLFGRMEKLLDGEVPACTLFSGPYYFAEQLGFRKVHRLHLHDRDHDHRRSGHGGRAQVFPRAAGARKRDIDLRPELYTHYYKNEFPERFHDVMDTRRWGPGERHRVRALYAKRSSRTRATGSRERGIFEGGDLGAKAYDERRSVSADVPGHVAARRTLASRECADDAPSATLSPISGRAWRGPSADPPSGRGARSRRAPAPARARSATARSRRAARPG